MKKLIALVGLMLLTSCSGASIRDCRKACMSGTLKQFTSDDMVCACAAAGWDL